MYGHICTENALRQPAHTFQHTQRSAAWMQEWKSESACLAFWFWFGNCSRPDLAVGNQRGDLPLLLLLFSYLMVAHHTFTLGRQKNRKFSANHLRWQMPTVPCAGCIKGLVLTKLLKKHRSFWSSGAWNCTSELCVWSWGWGYNLLCFPQANSCLREQQIRTILAFIFFDLLLELSPAVTNLIRRAIL